MNDKSVVKPPIWFWIVSTVALLWNLMGVSAYLMEAFMSEEVFNALPQTERLLYESRPKWVTAAFAFAGWNGLLGSIGLLLKKKWAKSAFLLSLFGVLLQHLHHFFLSNTFEVLGFTAMAFPIVIMLIGIGLVVFSNFSTKKNWLS